MAAPHRGRDPLGRLGGRGGGHRVATAFSPTDVLPLTRWAKLLKMLQSALSFSIVVLVIARAVNILK